MADEESPDPLPAGWTEQLVVKDGEQVKFFYNVLTGQKLYSKSDLPGYAELGCPSQGTRLQSRVQNKDNREKLLMLMPPENNTPDWLPQGWIVELNATARGTKYKRYMDPSTGRKFSSKPEVLRYLNSDKGNEPVSEQIAMNIGSTNNPSVVEASGAETPQKPEESPTLKRTSGKSGRKEKSYSNSRQKKVEIVRSAAEGLPPGWIKEIKIERIGNKIRKDPYYTDPVSKYVFRSCPDAIRYLETKDLKACITKPRKREELKFLSDDISIPEEQESHDRTTKEATGEEESNSLTNGQSPSRLLSKRKREMPVADSTINNIAQKPAEVIIDSTY